MPIGAGVHYEIYASICMVDSPYYLDIMFGSEHRPMAILRHTKGYLAYYYDNAANTYNNAVGAVWRTITSRRSLIASPMQSEHPFIALKFKLLTHVWDVGGNISISRWLGASSRL